MIEAKSLGRKHFRVLRCFGGIFSCPTPYVRCDGRVFFSKQSLALDFVYY